eukprot:TRINITY_DN1015_c0_g1_i3.p1 TRINITY_DN1015_c0_g1~~TRINITY_DN1015_c0_g1_i3.p1  ORF type:complete len:311 (+),score=52.76 TRINITY_DN1015_c0_g1_i3:219-1151(+)
MTSIDLTSELSVQCPSQTSQAGRKRVCEDCPGKMHCQSLANGQVDPDLEVIKTRMNAIKYKIIVMAGKGGVGKSSMTSLISYALAERGKKVGILDVDICGPSIPKLMNVTSQSVINTPYGWKPISDPTHKIGVMSIHFMLDSSDSPVMWRGPRKTQLIKRFLKDTFWGRLDFMIIDTPPGTSDEHLAVLSNLSTAQPTGAIIVTTPQDVALTTVRKEITFCQKMGIKILGIVENMSGYACPCCDEVTDIFRRGGGEALAKEFGFPFLGRVPIDPALGNSGEEGKCSICTYPKSAGVKGVNTVVDTLLSTL